MFHARIERSYVKENANDQRACKPGSVPIGSGGRNGFRPRRRWQRSFICARRLLVASIATYPSVDGEADRFCTLFGLAPDGVYRADRVTPIAGALLPHRFTLTTRPSGPSPGEPFGGLLSVALSLASRPVDVIDHPVLRSPDFPPVGKPPTSDRPALWSFELPNMIDHD